MKAAITAAALGVAAALATTAPSSAAGAMTVPSAQASDAVVISAGWRHRRSSDRCRPYNGPYGYYGNPYCEGGISRYGEAGGYEIDLTPYFDRHYWREGRRHRRWR
jgi:hypothetical protein